MSGTNLHGSDFDNVAHVNNENENILTKLSIFTSPWRQSNLYFGEIRKNTHIERRNLGVEKTSNISCN